MAGIGKAARNVGKRATLTTAEGLQIDVRIEDVRSAYGRIEYQVRPVHGKGEAWVTGSKLRF